MVLQNSLLISNDYKFVSKITHSEEKEAHDKCKNKETHDGQYVGSAISILRDSDRTNIHVRCYEYTVQRREDDEYCVDNLISIQPDVSIQPDAHDIFHAIVIQSSLTFAANPTLLNGLNVANDMIHSKNIWNITHTRSNTSDINAIHMAFNDANHTYINVVHDCQSVCVHATLNNASHFVQTGAIKQDGIACVNDLVTNSIHIKTIDNNTHRDTALTVLGGVSLLLAGGACVVCAVYGSKLITRVRNVLVSTIHSATLDMHVSTQRYDAEHKIQEVLDDKDNALYVNQHGEKQQTQSPETDNVCQNTTVSNMKFIAKIQESVKKAERILQKLNSLKAKIPSARDCVEVV